MTRRQSDVVQTIKFKGTRKRRTVMQFVRLKMDGKVLRRRQAKLSDADRLFQGVA